MPEETYHGTLLIWLHSCLFSDNSVLIAKESPGCSHTCGATSKSPGELIQKGPQQSRHNGHLRQTHLQRDGCLATENKFYNILSCCTEYLVIEFVIGRTRIKKNCDLCLFSLSPFFSQGVYLYFWQSSQRENITRSLPVGFTVK